MTSRVVQAGTVYKDTDGFIHVDDFQLYIMPEDLLRFYATVQRLVSPYVADCPAEDLETFWYTIGDEFKRATP